MNLTKRLQEAADRRNSEPPPLPILELGRSRDRSVTIHLEPVDPVGPVDPVDPVDRVGPVDLADRADPGDPADPAQEPIDLRSPEPEVVPPAPAPPARAYAAPAQEPHVQEPAGRGGASRLAALVRLVTRRDRGEPRDHVDHESEPMDVLVRSRRLDDVPISARTCPRCGALARLDIHDRTRGVLHLSCDECFKMWRITPEPSAGGSAPRPD